MVTTNGRVSTPKKPVPAVKVRTHILTVPLMYHVGLEVFIYVDGVSVGCDSQGAALHRSIPGTEQHGAGTHRSLAQCSCVIPVSVFSLSIDLSISFSSTE